MLVKHNFKPLQTMNIYYIDMLVKTIQFQTLLPWTTNIHKTINSHITIIVKKKVPQIYVKERG